jgi:hypothetical protein
MDSTPSLTRSVSGSTVSGLLRSRVRVNVAKTATKGYTADTTAEVEFDGDSVPALAHLERLLGDAHEISQREIANRRMDDFERKAASP